jgi:hypothetical protein
VNVGEQLGEVEGLRGRRAAERRQRLIACALTFIDDLHG